MYGESKEGQNHLFINLNDSIKRYQSAWGCGHTHIKQWLSPMRSQCCNYLTNHGGEKLPIHSCSICPYPLSLSQYNCLWQHFVVMNSYKFSESYFGDKNDPKWKTVTRHIDAEGTCWYNTICVVDTFYFDRFIII